MNPAVTRRGFVELLGGAALVGLAGTAGAQSVESADDFPGMYGLLVGPDSNRPAADGPYFDQWDEFRFVYIASDHGLWYVIEDADDAWTLLSIGSSTTPVPSLTAKDFFNSEIGDSVDYGDPRWLTRSDILINNINYFQSLNGAANSSSGSGSTSIQKQGSRVRVRTGSTDDSSARIVFGIGPPAVKEFDQTWDWDKDREVKFNTEFAQNKIEGMYVAVGRINEGKLTQAHIGIGIDSNGDLVGTVADGSTQNTTTLRAAANFSLKQSEVVRIVLTAGEEVEWFLGGESKGSVTTNIPTGSTGEPDEYSILAFNAASGGADGVVTFSRGLQVQMP